MVSHVYHHDAVVADGDGQLPPIFMRWFLSSQDRRVMFHTGTLVLLGNVFHLHALVC